MMETSHEDELSLNHEDTARLMLAHHYKNSYGDHVMEKVELLLALDGYIDRFNYLRHILEDNIKLLPTILVSGYAAGSEIIVARKFGFQEIHGVEVDPFLLEVTNNRLADLSGIFPVLHDGFHLPYDNDKFNVVISGHIIEHTRSPKTYLHETMRVLKTGGFLFIEFPSRYHFIELHTGLPSFEWLPTIMRNVVLQLISSRFSFLSSQKKIKYNSILSTGLKQVSRRDIFLLLKQMGIKSYEIDHSKPAPGYIRMIIKKL